MKKIKPLIDTANYPLQYSDITIKYFNIKELNKRIDESVRLKEFFHEEIPEIKEYYDLVFSKMDFKDLADFLSFYIEVRGSNLPSLVDYVNNQPIKVPDVDITSKIKRGT